METSIVMPEFVDARVAPRGALESLSQEEIEKLHDAGIPVRTPDILAPSLNVGGGGGGSWDV